MHYLLVTHGTEGDVHPFVGIGIELMKRGHAVTLMTNAHFTRHAERHGFDFVAIGTNEEYLREMNHADIYMNRAVAKILGRWMLRSMPDQHKGIVERFVPGQTAIVASGAAIGARIAHETHPIPMVSITLQPAILRSAVAPPVVAGAPPIPGWVPAPVIRAGLRVLDAYFDSVFLVPKINEFRAGLELSPIKRIMHEWWLSPQRVIATFPEWYAPMQPDWPAQLVHATFPLFDEREAAQTLDPKIQEFLDAGDAPLAFTPGSGMMLAHSFFETAVKACQLLNKRGILLTRFSEQIPNNLPDSILHVEFVPFSLLLPQCAALVHAGGIGTLSQALIAGTPQLIMPLVFDQPDNAARLKRMGVADSIKRQHFLAPTVARKLSALLNDESTHERCRHFAALLRKEKPIEVTCNLIESAVASAIDSRGD